LKELRDIEQLSIYLPSYNSNNILSNTTITTTSSNTSVSIPSVKGIFDIRKLVKKYAYFNFFLALCIGFILQVFIFIYISIYKIYLLYAYNHCNYINYITHFHVYI
jgi:hypothetical protein